MLENGQVWLQTNFPFHSFMLLSIPYEETFCRIALGDPPPMIKTNEDGKWKYTGKEINTMINLMRYSLVEK